MMDGTAATAGLVLLLPVNVVLGVLVRWRLGSPVMFKQVRPGLDGEPFTIYKYRTMTEAFDVSGCPHPDEVRLTPFGAFLRSTSLDELPELWNVLRGDMSIVGPRPLLMHYLDRYTPEQARRHEVRPGITGWSQVQGRNAVSWDERFEQDVWYVDNMSLWLDVKILWLTIARVLKREDITADGHVTMPEFTSSETTQDHA